jgi:hypothetical protein
MTIQSDFVSSNKHDIQEITLVKTPEDEIVAMRKSLLRPGCLNVYVSMPCP